MAKLIHSSSDNDLVTGEVIGEFNINYVEDETGTLQPQLVPISPGDTSLEELVNISPEIEYPSSPSESESTSNCTIIPKEMHAQQDIKSYSHVRIVITEQPRRNKLRFRYLFL